MTGRKTWSGEILENIHTVHNGDHAIQFQGTVSIVISPEGGDDWARVCHTCRGNESGGAKSV
jgi:hypothetical protein